MDLIQVFFSWQCPELLWSWTTQWKRKFPSYWAKYELIPRPELEADTGVILLLFTTIRGDYSAGKGHYNLPRSYSNGLEKLSKRNTYGGTKMLHQSYKDASLKFHVFGPRIFSQPKNWEKSTSSESFAHLELQTTIFSSGWLFQLPGKYILENL